MLQQLHWSGRATISAALGFLAATSVSADEHPGNLWKTTSQMTMQGMEMPANTVELCTAEDWNEPPPPPPDQACTQTNVQRTDTTLTWNVTCTGEMEMTGEGQITFETPDSYTGTITFTAQGMTMTVQLQGEKIGECDNPIN
jgi:hypothetical protein